MAALALALALAAGPGVRTSLPPAPVKLYEVAWQRAFVPVKPLDWKPQERGGVTVDPATKLAIFGTRDGWLHAVWPDGKLAWEFQASGALGPVAIEGDTAYVGSVDGRLYAVAIPTGKSRWEYKAGEDLTTRPAVAQGAVYVASLQDTLFCVDAATGAWRWHHRRETKAPNGFTIFGAAAALVGPDAVYGAYSDGFVAALDPKTGTARWEKQLAPPDDHLDVDGIVLDAGRLYAAAYSGALLAVDARSGDLAWKTAAPNASRIATAAGLVVAVTPTSIIGVSLADGSAVWTAPLGGTPEAAPVALGKWVLVPSGDQGLRWLEAATGRTLRVFEPGTGVSGPPGSIGRRVYVLSNGGDLFALDLP